MVYRKSGKVDVRKHIRRTENGFVPVVHHTRGYPPSTPEQMQMHSNTYGAKANSRRNVINFDDLEKDARIRSPNSDFDGDGVKNKDDCHPLDPKRQDDTIRIYQDIYGDWNVEINGVLQKDAWDTKEAAEIYAYEMRKGNEEAYDIYNLAYKKAEEKLKKEKPNEDEDGDGVKNKDDCHPLDPNKQDEEEMFQMSLVREFNKLSKKDQERILENLELHKKSVESLEKLEKELKKKYPKEDTDKDGVKNKFDCHPLDPKRQDENRLSEIRRKIRMGASDKKLGKEYGIIDFGAVDEYRNKIMENRLKEKKPNEDTDHDGVKNKDDCHPLDPNRQDYTKEELKKLIKEDALPHLRGYALMAKAVTGYYPLAVYEDIEKLEKVDENDKEEKQKKEIKKREMEIAQEMAEDGDD